MSKILWDQYALPLGREYHRLFSNSSTQSTLVDKFIKPTVFDGSTYWSIEAHAKVEGRHHHNAADLATGELPDAAWNAATYFTNMMRVGEGAPKDRCHLGDHVVFTYEHDREDIAFLKQQLDWLLPTKAWERSKIGKLYAHCSQWADFTGITVAWSGSKSLHVHITFEAKTYKALHEHVALPYDGLKRHWADLAADVAAILAPTMDGEPLPADTQLKVPVAYHRLPGGTRVLDKPNLLGMPAGTYVPQVVLWERFRERASKGSKALFFSPSKFAEGEIATRRNSKLAAQNIGETLTWDEVAYCQDKLSAYYGGVGVYPELHHITYDAGRGLWVARFRNGPGDRKPSSIMFETHSTIMLNGGHFVQQPKSLPFRLRTMIALWCDQLKTKELRAKLIDKGLDEGAADESIDDYFLFDAPKDRRPGERISATLAANVTDGATARAMMEASIPTLLAKERISLIRGPEGVAKTTSIIAQHPKIVSSIDREHGLEMYAFADYDNAIEKCSAFNNLGHEGYRGVVWPSFTRAYQDACKETGSDPITVEQAAKEGHQSLWSMITRKQPEVIEALQERHAAMWAEIGSDKPVLFTVHAVAHMWGQGSRSRRLWTETFWDQDPDKDAQLEATRLALLVHDEIKVDTFVELVPAETKAWVSNLYASNVELFDGTKMAEQLDAVSAYAAKEGWPRNQPIGFRDIMRLMAVSSWDLVETSDSGEYMVRAVDDAEKDIYASRHGRTWAVASRKWWRKDGRQIASRIVFLTTEFVPTKVAQKAHKGLYVVDFDTPLVGPDVVETFAIRGVNAASLPKLVVDRLIDLQGASGEEWRVVSNKCSGLDIGAYTHAKARGTNSLIGQNILQTATFAAPDVYEACQALNAWTGSSDLVLMTHIDELNQSCGRNLRFRRRGDERHVLFINKRLYNLLDLKGALGALRYDLQVQVEKEQRRDARRDK